VTKPARHIDELVLGALEALPVRIAPGPADAMAVDTELFACAAMTARAGKRIEPRLGTMLTAASRRGQPSGRMRALLRIVPGDAEGHVAIETRALAMASRAESRLSLRFDGVPRPEAGAVQPGKANVVESEARGQCRNDADPVTARAVALTVTRCA
jgi:hypothetical protein